MANNDLIIVLAAGGGIALAYAANVGGFRDWINSLGQSTGRAIQGVQYGIDPKTGLVNIGGAGKNSASPPGYNPGYVGPTTGAAAAPTSADKCAKLGLTNCPKGFHGIPHKGGGCDCVKGYTAGWASAYNTDAYPDQSITVS